MTTDIADNIEFYSDLYRQHGDSPLALNWGSEGSQARRFEVLADIGALEGQRILDLGCGLADFLAWFQARGIAVDYTGVEVTPALAQRAAARFPDAGIVCLDLDRFMQRKQEFDYVFASGVFYLRKVEPEDYLRRVISQMYKVARRGVAFNSLSTWLGERDPSEFYANPLNVLEFCRTLTTRVVLRHDYHPGDFSVYLYRD